MSNNKNKKTRLARRSLRVIVAMSGGVDSSVAAALLKKQGFDVVGIFMKFWKDGKAGKNACCSIESEKMARLVAKQISIPFYVLNAEKDFKKHVVDYFLKEYKNGTTPNPCVVCNKEIKFGYLIKKALGLGADFVATGHYAQVLPFRSATNFFPSAGNPPLPLRASGPGTAKSLLPRYNASSRLFESKDKEKDQSYFLCQLSQNQLKHVLFPVGGYTKPEVRKLAKKFKLPVAETAESQEVCFVPACAGRQNATNEFLKKYLKTKPGNIVDVSGKKIGQHQGLWFYTIGQRRGLGLGGSASASSGETKPFYVAGKNLKKNLLIVSKNQKDLLKKDLVAKNVNWLAGNEPKLPLKAKVKIRYRTKPANAVVSKIKDKKYKVIFTKPQRAITPGQSAVFYQGKELLGGGVIE